MKQKKIELEARPGHITLGVLSLWVTLVGQCLVRTMDKSKMFKENLNEGAFALGLQVPMLSGQLLQKGERLLG